MRVAPCLGDEPYPRHSAFAQPARQKNVEARITQTVTLPTPSPNAICNGMAMTVVTTRQANAS